MEHGNYFMCGSKDFILNDFQVEPMVGSGYIEEEFKVFEFVSGKGWKAVDGEFEVDEINERNTLVSWNDTGNSIYKFVVTKGGEKRIWVVEFNVKE